MNLALFMVKYQSGPTFGVKFIAASSQPTEGKSEIRHGEFQILSS
jgi:hypothetical protein